MGGKDETPKRHLGRAALEGTRILLVEDDPEARETLVFLLEMHGAEVRAVESVASALDAFELYEPDILLSDINLPDATGFDLILELRGRGEKMPAIAVSGDIEDEGAVLEKGFQGCLSKPVRAVDLAEMVSHFATKGKKET